MKKKLAFAIVLLLAGTAGAYYWKAKKNGAGKEAGTQYTTAAVENRPLKQEVSCSGKVESNLDVEVKCKSTGQVVELPYDVSNTVEKGALLLKIDPIDEERTERQTRVKLASAQAKLDRAKQSLVVSERELERTRKEAHATLRGAEASSKDLREKAARTAALLKKEYASPEEVSSAESAAVQGESTLQKASAGIDGIQVEEARLELLRQDINLAQADVDSIKIDLENAQQRLKETQVFAPMAGTVSTRLVQVGQIIASPMMNVGGGTSLLTLSDLSRIFVLADVDESDIGMVRDGQPATIKVDAFPDDQFKGQVVRVATKGSEVSNVVTFEVKIEILDEAKNKLLPKMTADVDILAAEKESTPSVPVEAVKRRGADKVVLVPGAGPEPEPVKVKTGVDNGTHIEILSGLKDGDTILIAHEQVDESKTKKDGFGGPPPGGGPPPM
jgi:HlyD family secretion protein